MSPEELIRHNQLKGEFSYAITGLLKSQRLGKFFHDRTLLSHARAELSTEPDGVFVSWDSFNKKRVRLVKGTEGYVELVGTPDMVLEVVSRTSVRKDSIVLRHRYWLARVPEYWLVDPRGDTPRFEILRRRSSGYAGIPKRAGWQASAVFGKSFKLTQSKDKLGFPEYTLAVR
jgi:Uma2 family endonuclease